MSKLRLFGAAVVVAVLASAFVSDGARADSVETLIEECRTQLEMSDAACACVGESAAYDLSQDQQDFALSLIWSDDAMAEDIADGMSDEEINDALIWLDDAPAICEGG